MANVFIAEFFGDELLIWTDARATDQPYSRRNVLRAGQHCLALHDDVERWLPHVRQAITNPALANLAVDQLANSITQELVRVAPTVQTPLGAVIGGFQPDGRPHLIGLHSERNFGARRFYPAVVGGLPTSIYNYLRVGLSVPQSREDAIDRIILTAQFYYNALIAKMGGPESSAIAVHKGGQNLAWLSEGAIQRSYERNQRRLRTLQRILSQQVSSRNE